MRELDPTVVRPAAAPVLLNGAILQSRYRIGKRLGEGGMGAVYEATDLRLNYTVAIKQIVTTDEAVWKQFEREAQLLARLSHPALPRVSDYFTEGNRAFFVMQYVQGADLAELITTGAGSFPPRQVIAWADQLLDALVYLHSQERQIIHRDIKPHNLKVNSTGQIVLLDFGLAKCSAAELSGHHTYSKSLFGYTPRYAPLEQIHDLGTTPRSDIYALGATLYHLLTGVKPPDAVTRAAAFVSSKPNPLRAADELNPDVGPELSAILTRAMSQNADDRYASAQEFREALRPLGRSYGEGLFDSWKTAEARADGDVAPDQQDVRSPKNRSRFVATWILILLTAFGFFCRYYDWKIPADERAATSGILMQSAQPARNDGVLELSKFRMQTEPGKN